MEGLLNMVFQNITIIQNSIKTRTVISKNTGSAVQGKYEKIIIRTEEIKRVIPNF